MKSNIILIEELQTANLIADAVCRCGSSGNGSDEVISKPLRVQNSSGFRFFA